VAQVRSPMRNDLTGSKGTEKTKRLVATQEKDKGSSPGGWKDKRPVKNQLNKEKGKEGGENRSPSRQKTTKRKPWGVTHQTRFSKQKEEKKLSEGRGADNFGAITKDPWEGSLLGQTRQHPASQGGEEESSGRARKPKKMQEWVREEW